MKKRPYLTLLILLISVFIALKIINRSNIATEEFVDEQGNYLIDPIYKSFYEDIDGFNLCGIPLTGKYLGDYGYYEQITTNCLFYFNPETKAVQMAPLGVLLNLYSDSTQFQSIPVHPDISTIYYETITPGIAGSPISAPVYDNENNLWVQNFENISIAYHSENGKFLLRDLGQQYCEKKGCTSPNSNNLLSTPPQSISEFMNRYPEFGSVILGEYINEFGITEYIFNGIVLYLQNEKIYLKKLPHETGTEPSDLEARISNDIYEEKLFHFFYVKDNLGYNVPAPILDYINQNLGGTRVSGPPISGNHLIVKNVTEICFTAYCLRYNLQEGSIQLSNLGVSYYDKVFNQQDTVIIEESENYQNLNVVITLDQTIISDTNQSTTAHALLFYNNSPMMGVIPTIRIVSSQSNEEFQMPSTDENGETIFTIEGSLLPNENGVVKISICILLEGEASPKCVDAKSLQLRFNP